MNAEKDKPEEISMLRILNTLVLIVIALSLLAQTIGLGLAWRGDSSNIASPLVLFFGMIGLFIFPGKVLALIKLVLNITRSYRDEKARFKAVLYFVIVAWPYLGVALVSLNSRHGISPVPAMYTSSGIAEEAEPKSAQFISGYEWAKQKLLVGIVECNGSLEFNRGCRSYINDNREELFLAGREWAKINLPAKASDCKGPVSFIKGCRNYFSERLEKPKPAGQYRYEGMTTAECIIEVNANYEALTQEFIENGNQHGADATRRRSWQPDLKDCENYDKLVENTFMPQASNRLQQLLKKLKTGNSINDEEKAAALHDFSEMTKVKDQPYKTYYFEQFSEYQDRISGQYKEPVKIYPRISCEEYQKKIDEMKSQDKERVAAMKALESDNGRVVIEGVKHDRLNKERIEMLWDWKLYHDGAKAAACIIK